MSFNPHSTNAKLNHTVPLEMAVWYSNRGFVVKPRRYLKSTELCCFVPINEIRKGVGTLIYNILAEESLNKLSSNDTYVERIRYI